MRRTLFVVATISTHLVVAQLPQNGLQLWLKADKDIIATGNGVTAWKDQSGHGFHATTTSVIPPQLVPNELNGLPVVRFNGLDNAIETVPFQTFPGKRGTVVVLVKVKGLGSTSGKGYGTFVSTYFNKGITWQLGATGPIAAYYDGVGSSGFPVADMSTGKWAIVILRRDADTLMQFQRDDAVKHSFRISNNQPDLNPLKIGSNGRLEVLNGDIAEIMVYDRAVSDAELNKIYKYLHTKYALALQRPDKKQGNWRIYGLSLVIAVGVSVWITRYTSQRKLRKKLAELERQQEMDKERQRISREMHDDIGAGLTQIIVMSESARNKKGEDAGHELDDIADTTRKLVSSMSEIIWSLNPENKTLDQLLAYLREQLHKQLEYTSIRYSIDLPENGEGIPLRNEQRRNLLLIFKEIVNNVIKHSSATEVSVRGSLSNHVLDIHITDNGKGFEAHTSPTGNGLKNIRHRVAEISGEITVVSAPGAGTRFRVTIPLERTT